MNTNVISEYIDFVKASILGFYKIILDNTYDKNLIEPLLNRYILVRYCGETSFLGEQDLIEILSKEFKNVIDPIMNKDNEEELKTIYALFVYVFYFDECYYIENTSLLLDSFFQDESIKVNFTEKKKREVTRFISKFNANKERFDLVFRSAYFGIEEKILKSNLYHVTLSQNVKVSNLYSEYAIEKAFNSGVVNEDKLFITLLMTSQKILNNAIGLDFSRYYLIDFVTTFLTKEKKIARVFNIIDNDLAKKYLILNIKYIDYILNKENIDSYIKMGFSFSVTIDDKFEDDYADLILFTCVIVNSKSENYDIIMENRKQISSTLIVI